jgi:hypothetical protein
VSTLTAVREPSKPREKTPTTNVDYVVTRDPNSGDPEGLISNFPDRFTETAREINDLLTWPEGWDGDDAPRPDPTAIRRALRWAEELYRDLRAGLWIKPHISADDGGEVTFEWWKGRKKLTVYVSPAAVEYVKVEKLGSSVKLEDGLIDPSKKRLALWNWLTS